tara:strand:+ start:457 stop:699 length:243 start_codon:yes stop_codon:yes gene_type:complete
LTDFICAYFGSDWTITARGFSSAKQAEKHGLYMMPTAGVFGFAVIKEDIGCWNVDWDRSILSPNNKVTQNNDLNTFNVSV